MKNPNRKTALFLGAAVLLGALTFFTFSRAYENVNAKTRLQEPAATAPELTTANVQPVDARLVEQSLPAGLPDSGTLDLPSVDVSGQELQKKKADSRELHDFGLRVSMNPNLADVFGKFDVRISEEALYDAVLKELDERETGKATTALALQEAALRTLAAYVDRVLVQEFFRSKELSVASADFAVREETGDGEARCLIVEYVGKLPFTGRKECRRILAPSEKATPALVQDFLDQTARNIELNHLSEVIRSGKLSHPGFDDYLQDATPETLARVLRKAATVTIEVPNLQTLAQLSLIVDLKRRGIGVKPRNDGEGSGADSLVSSVAPPAPDGSVEQYKAEMAAIQAFYRANKLCGLASTHARTNLRGELAFVMASTSFWHQERMLSCDVVTWHQDRDPERSRVAARDGTFLWEYKGGDSKLVQQPVPYDQRNTNFTEASVSTVLAEQLDQAKSVQILHTPREDYFVIGFCDEKPGTQTRVETAYYIRFSDYHLVRVNKRSVKGGDCLADVILVSRLYFAPTGEQHIDKAWSVLQHA